MNTTPHLLLEAFAKAYNQGNQARKDEIAIHEMKMLENSPYAMEFLKNFMFVTMGLPASISEDTVDKGIDFFIESCERRIDLTVHDELNRNKVKTEMKASFYAYRELYKNHLRNMGLLS